MKPAALDLSKNAIADSTTQLLSVPGGTIAYDDMGAGPLVICVPGIGDLRADYPHVEIADAVGPRIAGFLSERSGRAA